MIFYYYYFNIITTFYTSTIKGKTLIRAENGLNPQVDSHHAKLLPLVHLYYRLL